MFVLTECGEIWRWRWLQREGVPGSCWLPSNHIQKTWSYFVRAWSTKLNRHIRYFFLYFNFRLFLQEIKPHITTRNIIVYCLIVFFLVLFRRVFDTSRNLPSLVRMVRPLLSDLFSVCESILKQGNTTFWTFPSFVCGRNAFRMGERSEASIYEFYVLGYIA